MAEAAAAAKPAKKPTVKAAKEYTYNWEATDRKGAKIKGSSVGPSEALVKSQLVATQMSMLITFLPGFLLSGFAFDIDNMPVVLQGVSLMFPARYFIVVTRGIFLKGVGIEVLWPPILALTIFALVGLTLAVKVFHKELEP